ncbi:MAG: hypothetical protein UX38_C0005G0025 [Microgenomates group bacterium GW2011_GWC1_46_16]|uniref:Uncharacterized protein n=2 Tax=Candidatus Collieribacteriota TaxID=1752725 RepID=A0A1F5FYV0_9BACT|nr:MAG: hypothetical protein UX32_C0007G0006 [Microgenomates group bacterium GW2011_GWF1_46_12]KKU26522.1 MAG: hypothetical protein UX38_C0005G0025 [Microgenomates group bacterium GW2011_GWC1_46_16]KKU28215.1 MAG: hypothetical protein UX40_C0002G0055 [Microgenomates group bacterium GW2011_GWF2_46_18]KKU45136.1 MAG: hypothetical protein UX63_C0011G0008 [Microgenomates group bacterium GW2011_GWB1_46_7]KKU61589.1 MAG: hypothetical protein UX82_C0003G0054 [Microgenomates group bacterium GW2011_GWE1
MPSQQEIDQEFLALQKLWKKDRLVDFGLKAGLVIGVLGVLFAPTLEHKLLLGWISLGSAGVLTAPGAHEALKKIFPPKE